jgi:uncharacterized oligopeptide transporter (OPT) family protein
MERGELEWFDPDVFRNYCTGALEQYLDERNKAYSFKMSKFVWKKVAVGLFIGTCFALINQYVGLKVGLITGGGWYIVYLIGLALRWSPTETNIASGSSTGADRMCVGFVFTFPAIYLLAYSVAYLGSGGQRIVSPGAIEALLPIALISAMLAGFMGVMYFIIFRRVWLVEDPLPMPAVPGFVKLMDIINDISRGAIAQARKSIKIVLGVASATMVFVFFRDFPIFDTGRVDKHGVPIVNSVFDQIFGGKYYAHGTVMQPYETAHYTHLGFTFTPIQFALGWFLKFRVAALLTSGTLLTYFLIMPLAVHFEVPVYIVHRLETGVILEGFFKVTDPTLIEEGVSEALSPAWLARARIGRIMAIGAILGGGITALLKMIPAFKAATADIRGLRKGVKRKDWVKRGGWYEWPVTHIIPMMVITIIGIGIAFTIGFGLEKVAQSFIFAIILVAVTFVLGAIAVKVAGEVGTTPVSGTSFITLLLLVGVFLALGTDIETTTIMALLGTAVFGTAISLASDIMWDFRLGIYCGTRPFHLIKGETFGVICGATVAVTGAAAFSYGLAQGLLPLEAPQAHAFATFTQVLMGGQSSEQVIHLLLLGVVIGIFMELLTGMGTAFGLGMYLPLHYSLPLLVGGSLRDLWEKKWLEPKAKREGWSEREKTMKLLVSYMVAVGLLIGAALMGTIVAVYILVRM